MQLLCLTKIISYLNASDSSNFSNQNNIYPVESFLEIIPQTSSERYIKGSNSLLQNVGENKDTSLELVDNHFDSSEEEFIIIPIPQELTEENFRLLEKELDHKIEAFLELEDKNLKIDNEEFEDRSVRSDIAFAESRDLPLEITSENLDMLEIDFDEHTHALFESENKLSDKKSRIKSENNVELVNLAEKQESRCYKNISFVMGVFAACAVIGYAFFKGSK
ncbi:uncharacterized protein VNE69_03056 [Vairimorpha necatrix]|uniref:Uncharacterized protein n=1 Tax=Vairimorpha necatrix TaxID=6039 RepID=A0AAX4JA54_9MICR